MTNDDREDFIEWRVVGGVGGVTAAITRILRQFDEFDESYR